LTDPLQIVAIYHWLTRNNVALAAADHFRLLAYREGVDFRPLDPANRPAPFKRYRNVERVVLPAPAPAGGEAIAALGGGTAGDAPLDARGLARLLHLSAGVTRAASTREGGRIYFRAAMSAGNLHPLEVYVMSGPLDGLAAGVYHFTPLEAGLDRLRATDERAFLAGAVAGDAVPAVFLVITGIPWRTAWKYGERGWRHLYWDAGTLLANLAAAAAGAGLRTRVRTVFADADVARLVGVDGVDEFPLAVVEVGPAVPADGDAPEPTLLNLATEPVSPRPVTFPLITEAQRAGALERHELRRASQADGVLAADPCGMTVDEAILRRGATRLMRREPVPRRSLDLGLAVAARELVHDRRTPATLTHYVNVHAVAGVAPGAYEGDCLLEPGDQRRRSRRLCLDQPLAGDAAFTVFHSAQLDAVCDAHGARGYRLANFSAGIAAGRLALAATALGLGASGLTFRDDEVPAAFGSEAACLLATAVGVPAYRSRRGGAPGDPTELTA
jgi:SagB-type dehydrogenase family enzyme